MRNPQVILDILTKKTIVDGYKHERIYRLLYNVDLYLVSYEKLKSKEGNMTKGADNKTIDGFNIELIEKIIEELKNESYSPTPVRRKYIDKKNGKKRPLGIPSFKDKLVQEVVRMILESIYEPIFKDNSHGFRPNKSCHTAFADIQNHFSGTTWWIEGDIEGFFDNIDHSTLTNLLRKKIKDEKFIRLIYKFLNAGYLEDWIYHRTYSGTPQGGIISPILANIYLHEFDEFIIELKNEFDKGKERKINSEWNKLNKKIYRRRIKFKDENTTSEAREVLRLELKQLELQRSKTASRNPMDETFRRLKYIRYADDWLIGVIGSKEDAIILKDKISQYLLNQLKLKLSAEKTLITHNSKLVRFLGYNIGIHEGYRKTGKDGNIKVSTAGNVTFYLPHDCMRDFMLKNKFIKINDDGSWKAIHKPTLVNLEDIEIISYYNSAIRGFYNYYKYANNVCNFADARYLIRLSWGRTMANKYKSSVNKIFSKHKQNGVIGVYYETKKGTKFRPFHNDPVEKVRLTKFINAENDNQPNLSLYLSRTSISRRLLANQCEFCGKTHCKLEVHHVRKLKDLVGKQLWERLMIERHRKQLVLCKECHVKLHNGTL
ncbi:reverse transcriptase domain-containing protein [Clostridium perfringens]|uniref:reverse transcriptase/maturase family protein n=1 Tax=Clostridium perfringens TaxID=1502 RepID=UPI0024BBFBC0|nr:reverse transcriptase/maturase family protein [Clostridium perfringens]